MTEFHLSFAPLVSLEAIIALGAVGLLVVALGLWARRRGTFLRALGLALVLASLANPSFLKENRKPLKTVVAVVVDRSGSQTIGDRPQQTSAARAIIARRLAALGVEARFVDTTSRDPDNQGTRLFTALNNALADVPPDRIGGVLMITDGQVDDIPRNASSLGFHAPIHALITGRPGERDRRIELVEAPKFGIVGKDLTIVARVLDTRNSNEPATIVVRRDGAEIARLRTRPGQRVNIPVRIKHGGPNFIELDAPPLAGELTAINNKAVLTVDGVRDKLKVLLVSGEPNPGERTWRNLLKSDPNVDLVHFTILRPPEKQDGTPINELSLIAFPTADLFGRKIKDFDLIIFDRYSDQTILPSVYLENIVRYVRNGGALLLGAGPDFATRDGLYYSPLGKITPVKPDGKIIERGFWPRVSAAGEKDPVTRGLEGSTSNPPRWSEWFRQIEATKTGGVSVLNGAGGRPLLVLAHEGKGRVATLLSDQIWLWARGFQGGGPFVDLLRRTAHWLMKQPALNEESLTAETRGDEIEITRQSLKNAVSPVTVTTPSGRTERVTLAPGKPGLWAAQIRSRELGLYHLTEGSLTALVNVGPENPREFQAVVSTGKKLLPIAKATGGTVRRLSNGPGAAIAVPRIVAIDEAAVYGGADYIGVKKTSASILLGVSSTPLAIGFLGLLLLLGAATAGWLWEGRGGRTD